MRIPIESAVLASTCSSRLKRLAELKMRRWSVRRRRRRRRSATWKLGNLEIACETGGKSLLAFWSTRRATWSHSKRKRETSMFGWWKPSRWPAEFISISRPIESLTWRTVLSRRICVALVGPTAMLASPTSRPPLLWSASQQ